MLKLIYQLPNGKVIKITVEEFLDLTDEEIIYIVSLDLGESANTPWLGSSLPSNKKNTSMDFYDDFEDSQGREISFDDLDGEEPEIPYEDVE